MDTMMTPQANGPSYFFYSPDPNPESRQHGRFIPQQHPAIHPITMLPIVAPLPSTPIYSRPGSSSSQPPLLPKGFNASLLHSTLTPMASPMPIVPRPMIVLDTDLGEDDGFYSPSTPPLSSSGSVISSPGSCDMLQTPLNPMFSGLESMEGKPSCDMDGELESFPILDWSACASPPLTPVYLHPQQQASRIAPLNIQTSDLLSPASSCPSLSPSPSPYARSVSSDDFDFCDPRNLTVGTVNSTLSPEFSTLPTLCAGEDEDQKFVLRGATPSISPNSSFDFTSQLCDGLPSFEDFSDLDSDDDFVNGLVNLSECVSTQISRSRASSDAVSLSHSEDFEVSDAFGADSLLSPASSCEDCEDCEDSDAHKNKRQKSQDTKQPIMSTAADSQSGATEQQTQTPPSNQESSSSTAPEGNNASGSNSGSENAGTPAQLPSSRRGRKQSLTEDPSKTFICDICNRRFRRQEHLKRHYRSLHTHDKPFECGECGKKFSRSDNLAQHSRTHGSGAIIMDLIDGSEGMAGAMTAGAVMHPDYPHPHPAMMGDVGGTVSDYHTMGKVLFQVTADIPGSASEPSSDEGSEQSKKKRKRTD